MKLIETKNAVGHVLCHDLTRIVPGEFKGAQFRKGHIVTEDDIPMLLSMGKEHLYVWEMEPGMLHENDAADRAAGARRSWSCCRTSSKPPPSSRPAARSPAAAFRIRSPRSLKRSSGSTASP